MIKRALFVALVFCSWASSALGATPEGSRLTLPVPDLETLPNGLQVAWFLNDRLPLVDMGLLVRSGSRDDPRGKSGTAQLLINSLDRGAAGLSASQLAQAIEKLGGSRFTTMDEDSLSVGVHGLAQDAPALLELLGKIALRPDFTEAEVKREQRKALDTWAHLGDYTETLASLAFRRLLTAGTSYARGSFLSAREFKEVARADVVAFHKKHFVPKNALLVIVGRVDRAKFRELVLTAFGGWRPTEGEKEIPAREWRTDYVTQPRPGRAKIVVVDRPGLNQTSVKIGFRAPLVTAPNHYALVVANALLGEHFNSRLNSLVRDKLALTYAIGSGFTYNKDLATFAISSTTRDETVGSMVTKVLEVLRTLKSTPVPEDEVTITKEYLIGGFPIGTATLSAVAIRWLGGHAFGLGPDYLNEFIPKLSAVTAQEVNAAIAKDFKIDALTIVVAGNAKVIQSSLKESRLGPVSVISARDF